MAELDEIVQKVMIDGDSEVAERLNRVGETGEKVFEQIAEMAERGASSVELFSTAIGGMAGVIASLAVAITGFIEHNDEATQKLNLLAAAMGGTTEQVSALEAAFAQAGVSTQQFEQFATRLTTTIAREWPAIAESVRTSASEQEGANERVTASIIRVQEAQAHLSLAQDKASSAVTNAALSESEAYIKLQFSAGQALSTMVSDINNVASANLSLESAEQRLQTLQGNPPSASEKQALAIREAQLAVDKARASAADAVRKQQQDQAEAATKAAKAEQEASDAALKSQTAQIENLNARKKAELAVKEAVTATAEAEEHSAQIALKNIPAITEALKGVANGAKESANGIDLTQVSIQNMVKGIINLAAEGNKLPPPGIKVMQELMKVFSSDAGKLIDETQKLAIVQALSQRGFSQTNTAASELLKVLERGPDFYKKFEEAAKAHAATTEASAHVVEHFKDALTTLGYQIDLVNRDLAIAASPAFAEFLEAITESLTKSGGTLNIFVQGLKNIGTAFAALVEAGKEVFAAIDKAFTWEKGRAFQVAIGLLVIAVAAFASAWVGIPALIAVVIVAIGNIGPALEKIKKFYEDHKAAITGIAVAIGIILLAFAPWTVAIGVAGAAVTLLVQNWDLVKEKAGKAWDAVKAGITSAMKPLADFVDNLKAAYDWATRLADKLRGVSSGIGDAAAQATGRAAGAEGNDDGVKLAGGGRVSGPGTSTSDSVLSWLSDGEYVVKAASVQKFGVGFMHAINNGFLPGFAMGGPVSGVARGAASGLSSVQASRPLNLTIDGKTFSGLRGPSHVVNDLANFAVSRQTSSAGRRPSWVK